MRVTSRRTTASGPPERASSTPASTSAVRTVPRGRGPRRGDRSLVRLPVSALPAATARIIVDSAHKSAYSGQRPHIVKQGSHPTSRPRLRDNHTLLMITHVVALYCWRVLSPRRSGFSPALRRHLETGLASASRATSAAHQEGLPPRTFDPPKRIEAVSM